jgi:hypothetical protein
MAIKVRFMISLLAARTICQTTGDFYAAFRGGCVGAGRNGGGAKGFYTLGVLKQIEAAVRRSGSSRNGRSAIAL